MRSTSHQERTGPANRLRYLLLLAVTVLILELPVLTLQRPPLMDLPNHVARAYILYQYDVVPQFTARFHIDYSPLPNLAMDAVVVALQSLVNVIAASKIFVALVVFLFVMACHTLGRSIRGRDTYTALLCASLLYSATFLFGFLNYLLGVAVYFLVFSIYWRWKENFTPLRVVILAILAAVSFLCHLTSFGFVALSIAFVALWDFLKKRSWRDLLLSSAALVPGFLLTAFHWLRYQSGGGLHVAYAGLPSKVAVVGSVIRTFNLKLDAFLVLLLLIVFAIVLVKGTSWRMNWPVLALGTAFIVFAMVTPFEFGTSQYFDVRFMLPGSVLAILAVEVNLRPRDALAVFVVLATLVSLRTGNIWREWRSMDREAATIIESFSRLEEGCRIAVRQFMPQDITSRRTRMLYAHVIQYATVARNCTPENLLAIPGQQAVLWRDWKPSYVDPPPHNKPLPTSADSDYVVTYLAPETLKTHLERNARPIYSQGHFVLWSFKEAPQRESSRPLEAEH